MRNIDQLPPHMRPDQGVECATQEYALTGNHNLLVHGTMLQLTELSGQGPTHFN